MMRGSLSEGLVAPFVDGALLESAAGEDAVEIINPSTGRRLRSIPRGRDSDVNAAVRSARAAFDVGRWSETPSSSKKRVLYRFAELISQEAAELDGLDAIEMGKPVS